MPLLRHHDNPGEIRFVTFSTFERRKLLSTDLLCEHICQAISETRRKSGFSLWAYVLMPEHVHLVILPASGTKLGQIIGTLKWESAMAIHRDPVARSGLIKIGQHEISRTNGKFAFWQRRCFDRNCRDADEVTQKIRYCHRNPVQRGLVRKPEDYKWSSYGWYEGRRDVPLLIDPVEL